MYQQEKVRAAPIFGYRMEQVRLEINLIKADGGRASID
jgi:hypothetical protein